METKRETANKQNLIQTDYSPLLEAIRSTVKEELQALIRLQSSDPYPGVPLLGYGIKESARLLHVSPSTLSRAKESGEIDDCIHQSGKIVIFNIHRILDKWRVSNHRHKVNLPKIVKHGTTKEPVTSTRSDPRDKYGRSNQQRPSREP